MKNVSLGPLLLQCGCWRGQFLEQINGFVAPNACLGLTVLIVIQNCEVFVKLRELKVVFCAIRLLFCQIFLNSDGTLQEGLRFREPFLAC